MAYFLRTTDKNGRAYGGFQWPLEVGAVVTAPDWKPTKECGHGLHGLLDGGQDGKYLNWSEDSLWWVVEAEDYIDIDGKCKFESCRVVMFGDRKTVTDFFVNLGKSGVHGAFVVAGDGGTATAGDGGMATAGDHGTATAGNYGTATAGNDGTATAGDRGTATAGNYGTATAGDCGTIQIKYWCSIFKRYKIKTGYIGEDGLKPNVAYILGLNKEFVRK